MWVPSVAVTMLLLRFGSFDQVRDSRVGACLRRSMTSAVEALRFGGLGLAAWAAGAHVRAGIAAGFGVIALCWCWVFYRPDPHSVG